MQKGFTLIELSIVVVIIGLIVAGVVGGQQLVRQAQIKSMITFAESIEAAVNTFKLQYDALPGDMTNASSYWSSQSNGDGDGLISQTLGMKHLTASGLIKSVVEGKGCSAEHIPGPGDDACFRLLGYSGSNFIGGKNFVVMDNTLTILEAYNLDLKREEGLPWGIRHNSVEIYGLS